MTEQKKLVPKRRFKEYQNTDAWEQHYLSEVGNFLRTSVDPQATPDDSFVEYSMPSYDNGRNPETVFGDSMQSMRLKISGDVLLINKLNVRQKRIWLVEDAPCNAVASSEFMPFTSTEIDLAFLEQLMLSDKITRDLESISSGTSNSQKRITPSDLLMYRIKLPVDRAEQEKIGSLFKNIDNLITLHQRKLEKTKALKSAYLSEMFPAEGECEPRRRFAGFTAAWEQRELREIVKEKISNGMMNRPGKNELRVKHINVGNLYSRSHIHPDELEFIDATQSEVDKYNVEIGDIFLTRSSLKVEGIAQANIILEGGNFVFDDHLMRMKLKDNNYPFFVKELLNNKVVKNQFMSKAKTGTMTTIGQGDISSSYAFFPNIEEQRKVGAFFSELDHLITLHQRKLEKLQSIKKAYLNEMFV